jgi:hypothetical protein
MAMPAEEAASRLFKNPHHTFSPREKEHCGPSSDTEVCANLLSHWERTEVREFRLNVYLRCLRRRLQVTHDLVRFFNVVRAQNHQAVRRIQRRSHVGVFDIYLGLRETLRNSAKRARMVFSLDH